MMFVLPPHRAAGPRQRKLCFKGSPRSAAAACHGGGTAARGERDKHLKREMKEASNISTACKTESCFPLPF